MCLEKAGLVEMTYQKWMGFQDQKGNQTCVGKTATLQNIMLIGLLVIGCLAIIGNVSATITNWTAVGVGGATAMLQLIGCNLKKRKWDVLTSLLFSGAISALGGLAIYGIVSTEISYTLIGLTLSQAVIYLCCFRAEAASFLDKTLTQGSV